MPVQQRRFNSLLGWIRKSVASRSRKVILLQSTGERHLECWHQCWALQKKHGHSGVSPAKGNKDAEGIGASDL